MAVKMTNEEHAELLDCLLDMGQLLLESGAEISRVEDTISRVALSYGTKHADVFVITSIISISLEFSASDFVTETRRIYSSSGTDFYRIERLNDLSRRICINPVSLVEFRESLNEIALMHKPFLLILPGSMLAAGSFAVFFGGTLTDGIISSIFAVMICFMQKRLEHVSTTASNLLISFITGLGVGLLCLAVPILDMDKILIGDIMLLIPGLAMTNAVRNMLVGNTISGIIRLTECLIWALALAGGFMTAMLVIDTLF